MNTKLELRRQMEQLRNTIQPHDHQEMSLQICHRAIAFIRHDTNHRGVTSPPSIFIYLPFRSEVNIMPLVQFCWREGFKVYAPRVHREMLLMELHPIASEADLETGIWGIREPKKSLPILSEVDYYSLTWMIVPGLAFDCEGGRVGYGGGYYDRFMDRLADRQADDHGNTGPVRMALAFEHQVVSKVPMEPHDFRVEVLITEDKTLEIR